MIVIGIDPGTTRIGYGVVEYNKNRLTCLAYGTIGKEKIDRFDNLKGVEEDLSKIIQKYKPDRSGIEKLFFFKNQKTVMGVSEMRGVLLLTLAKHGIPIQELTPPQVKQSISSYGKAQKDQVQKMVQLLLNLKEPVKPDDAADALAIAICCTNNIMQLIIYFVFFECAEFPQEIITFKKDLLHAS